VLNISNGIQVVSRIPGYRCGTGAHLETSEGGLVYPNKKTSATRKLTIACIMACPRIQFNCSGERTCT
jgi:hypothetical protein